MRFKEMAEYLWNSHRGFLLLLGILLLLNLGISFSIAQFVTPRVVAQEASFLKRQAEVRQILHNQGGGVQSPEQLYILSSQDISKFHQEVPPYEEFTGLIEELLVLSNKAGLNIAQISYSSEQLKGSPLLKFGLNFNVTGDYGQIKRFIHSLEQSTRVVVIKQISLQGDEGNVVNLRLNLETYFQPGGQES